ncbi:uncharacterized protein BCR38DRAFT_206095 [Pseudomassariella vexata]|uniref:Uncharacterized protein n=1 Tax=Pseudomassariella vexata TaxID=1141098 RepID=A0A1Y2DXN9_9PEZI|nr:uncharacterized protein BCR38DRAFT_206095 [Pseudomassariella vexata]ORY64070.1 hypothetical protein BCR38DRAFT_206095 [Pseudomassariella vexata]
MRGSSDSFQGLTDVESIAVVGRWLLSPRATIDDDCCVEVVNCAAPEDQSERPIRQWLAHGGGAAAASVINCWYRRLVSLHDASQRLHIVYVLFGGLVRFTESPFTQDEKYVHFSRVEICWFTVNFWIDMVIAGLEVVIIYKTVNEWGLTTILWQVLPC